MVFCEATDVSFVFAWLSLTAVAIVMVFFMSGIVFYNYYANVTFEKWTRKSNPEFPPAEKVRLEIMQTVKCIIAATVLPVLSMVFAQRGIGNAYCGIKNGVGYEVMNFFLIWLMSDFWEFFYHWLGHRFDFMWKIHCHHHVFYNPSPFAVIADEYVDQLWRSAPLLLFPLIWPVNVDLMFMQFGLLFYAYGTYLHWGYELDWPDAHHPYINTSFQHYLHHAKSIKNKPYSCGFWFKLWDQLFGSVYPHEEKGCNCAKCEREAGRRSIELYNKVEKPDYSVLLSVEWWWNERPESASGKKAS